MPKLNNFRTFGLLGLLFTLFATLLLTACGEQEKVFNVGIYIENPAPQARLDGLKDGLKNLSYTEGKNINLIPLDVTSMTKEQQETALKDFVAKDYDAYWAIGFNAGQTLQKNVTRKPIVVAGLVDADKVGLVQSLEKPGGNLTGIDPLTTELVLERMRWLVKYDSNIKKVYFLYDPKNQAQTGRLESVRAEAAKLGLTLIEKAANGKPENQKTINDFKASEAQAILTSAIYPFSAAAPELKAAVQREKLILVGVERSHLEQAGALFSYGVNDYPLGKQSASYIDKVLRGTSPATLPIIRADKIELVLNQKLAEQLKFTFSETFTKAADEIVK